MFLQASVILSTGRGEGVCLSACWDARPPPGPGTPRAGTPPSPQSRHPPLEQTPPGPGTPPDQAHTRTRHTPPDQAPPRAGTPPPPLPRSRHPPDQAPPRPGTPPREADASIRSMSGRYASYWNAFLFCDVDSPPMIFYSLPNKYFHVTWFIFDWFLFYSKYFYNIDLWLSAYCTIKILIWPSLILTITSGRST